METFDYVKDFRCVGDTKPMHISNYVYVVDISESHQVINYTPDGPLCVHEVEVISCRTMMDDNDRKFYIPTTIAKMLTLPDTLPYWAYGGLDWVSTDLAKYVKVIESNGKLIVCLSHIDYDTL